MDSVISTVAEDLEIKSIPDTGFINQFKESSHMHIHSYYEVLIAIEGEIYIELSGGEALVMPKGSVCLIPPGLYHSVRAYTPTAKKLALRFSYEKLAKKEIYEQLFSLWHTAISSVKGARFIENNDELYRISLEIYEELNAKRIGYIAYINSLFLQFHLTLLRALSQNKNGEVSTTWDNSEELDLRRVFIDEFLYSTYKSGCTEKDLADAMHLSVRQVSRIIKDSYKTSFRQLLIDFRLHMAAHLLLSCDRAIEDIASEVGYSSISGFYTAFLKKFGVSAGKYRKSFAKK